MDLVARITHLNARLAVIRDVFIQRSKLQKQALKEGAILQDQLRLQHIAYDERISRLAPLFVQQTVVPVQATDVSWVSLQGDNLINEKSIQGENGCFVMPDDNGQERRDALAKGNDGGNKPARLQFDSDEDDFIDETSAESLNSLDRNIVEDANSGQELEADEIPMDEESSERVQVFAEYQHHLDNEPEEDRHSDSGVSNSPLDGESTDPMELRTVVHYHLVDDVTEKAEEKNQEASAGTHPNEPKLNDHDVFVEPEDLSDQTKQVVEDLVSTVVANERIKDAI